MSRRLSDPTVPTPSHSRRFLLAVLVALVKLGSWATVLPGTGLIAFAAVVVLTMLASASFDPRVIWQNR